jgi:hypothetical protein
LEIKHSIQTKRGCRVTFQNERGLAPLGRAASSPFPVISKYTATLHVCASPHRELYKSKNTTQHKATQHGTTEHNIGIGPKGRSEILIDSILP